MNIKTIVTMASLMFSLGVIAQDDWVKTQTVTAHGLNAGAETSAILKNLSPAAIELGLRDTQILAEVSLNKKNNVLNYHWHSLVKDINGTTYAQALTEPLTSEAKIANGVESVDAGVELVAKGDIDSLLTDFQRLLAKAEESTEIEENSTLNQETNNESNNASGGSDGGGALGGDSGGLTENPDSEDLELDLDEIISNVEECSMMIDLPNMIISKQERTIKTNAASGEIVETGDCKPVGQTFPIRKEFSDSCSTKLNESSGQYIQGHKLYSYVDGNRYNISECEWDNADARPYKVEKDFNSCSLDLAVIEPESGVYQPAFIEYTTIDGNRKNLSECITSPNDTKPLPVVHEKCEFVNDFETMISSEQHKKVFMSPDNKKSVKEFGCIDTGNKYDIQRDFEVLQCTNIPDYLSGKMLQSFKMFIQYQGAKKYLSDCRIDPEFSLPLLQDNDNCEASTNLTTNLATITKKWYVETKNGGKEWVSDCELTDETYPIVDSAEMCTPQYIPEQNKVVVLSQKVWTDAKGHTHQVTNCRPSSDELEVKKEFCNSPQFEHDFVGGQSYYRSRDYYELNGNREYLNECSRDPSESLPHTLSTTGCPTAHDDKALRSQVFSKTLINVPSSGALEIKGCEAKGGTIPYQYTGGGLNRVFNVYLEGANNFNIGSICTRGQAYVGGKKIPLSSPQAMGDLNKYGTMRYKPNPSARGAEHGYNQTEATIHFSSKDWTRADNSNYRQVTDYTCSPG